MTKVKCERCDGTGLAKRTVKCAKCNGKKNVWVKYAGHSKKIRQPCPTCKGTGTVRLRCRLCEGYGWYKPKVKKVKLGTRRWY